MQFLCTFCPIFAPFAPLTSPDPTQIFFPSSFEKWLIDLTLNFSLGRTVLAPLRYTMHSVRLCISTEFLIALRVQISVCSCRKHPGGVYSAHRRPGELFVQKLGYSRLSSFVSYVSTSIVWFLSWLILYNNNNNTHICTRQCSTQLHNNWQETSVYE